MSIEEVKSKYEAELLSLEGVVGIGIGESKTGAACIKLYVAQKTPQIEKMAPQEVEGFAIEIEEVGEVKAQ